jgi:hypothetical protein
MRRRSIVLLTGGLLALAMAPPVFGAGDSDTPAPGQSATTSSTTYAPPDSDSSATTATSAPGSPTTTTTEPDPGADSPEPDPGTGEPDPGTGEPDPGADSPAPSDNCATPETAHSPAPAEGASEIYPAGEAGQVEVSRTSATDLEIVDAVANDGWTAEITAPTGPRVKVRFVDNANSSSKTRFAAAMDQNGEEIHVRVTSCG